MKRYKVEVNDVWCRVVPMDFFSIRGCEKRYCIVCRKELMHGDKVSLLINNYVHFPNCLIHASCMEDLGGAKECVLALKARYNDAVKILGHADARWPVRDIIDEAP